MITFIEKLKNVPMAEFSFSSFVKKVTTESDGEGLLPYYTFELVEPIEKVTASASLYDPQTKERVHPYEEDVLEVTCMESTIEKYPEGWVFDEDAQGNLTKSGSYRGKLMLDLASSGVVWLTDVKFSKVGQDFRDKKRSEKFQKFVPKKS